MPQNRPEDVPFYQSDVSPHRTLLMLSCLDESSASEKLLTSSRISQRVTYITDDRGR